MSHYSHLPPEVDEAIRSFIRRHKHGLRWGCLGARLLAVALIVVAAWGFFRGAVRVKDWVTGKAPAIRPPREWEKPLGDAALAQLWKNSAPCRLALTSHSSGHEKLPR